MAFRVPIIKIPNQGYSLGMGGPKPKDHTGLCGVRTEEIIAFKISSFMKEV